MRSILEKVRLRNLARSCFEEKKVDAPSVHEVHPRIGDRSCLKNI